MLGAEACPIAPLPPSRVALLCVLFFAICCGLGYPSLNRVDWRQAPGGLGDVLTYADMVSSQPAQDRSDHMRFRILVPCLAKPFYRLAKGRLGSWDPVMFGLLVVTSAFVALTAALLLLLLFHLSGDYGTALTAALLYLLNFAIPNLRLVGMVDAGEGFFLMLAIWLLYRERFWALPLCAIAGATAKETFVPFFAVFSLTWWLASPASRRTRMAAAWIAASVGAAFASLSALQWKLTGTFISPLRFGLELHGQDAYLPHILRSFSDRNLWYIFIWLLPLSLPRLRHMPRNWTVATAATALTAFALDAYYGGGPGTIGRALFTVAGPLLTAAAAIFLVPSRGDPNKYPDSGVARRTAETA